MDGHDNRRLRRHKTTVAQQTPLEIEVAITRAEVHALGRHSDRTGNHETDRTKFSQLIETQPDAKTFHPVQGRGQRSRRRRDLLAVQHDETPTHAKCRHQNALARA